MQLTGNCCNNLCSEFKLKNFGFDHDHQDQFYRSQNSREHEPSGVYIKHAFKPILPKYYDYVSAFKWQSGERSWLYLCYRWIWALFFMAVFLACVILQYCEGKYFIFLTNWGIILCLLTQLIAAILVTRWHFDSNGVRSNNCEGHGGVKKSPLLVKLYWLLHDVALPLALVITTIYWSFLHGKMNKPSRFPIISFVTHCLNSVFMLVDFLIVAFPVRLLHTLYAMMLPIIFCFFTVIYFFCGGTDEYGNHFVYPLLDWTVPLRGVATFVGVFGLYCIYSILLFVVFKIKRFVHRSLSVVWSPHCVGLI